MAATPRRQNCAETDVPLDFSFLHINEMSELENEEPRRQLKKKVEKVLIPPENEGDDPKEKYATRCLRLNNNVLQELKNFMDVLTNILVDPMAMTWIDLSCNELTKIDACLRYLPSIQILYLHGNAITEIKEAHKIKNDMPKLHKLSLHGNPIDKTKNYRQYILSMVPQLRSLDFCPVTKADVATASTWEKMNTQKKNKNKSED